MKFEDALYAMRQGKSVSCGKGDDYWYIYKNILHYDAGNGYDTHLVVPSHNDMMSEKWRITNSLLAEGVPSRKHEGGGLDPGPWTYEVQMDPQDDTLGGLREHVDEMVCGLATRCRDSEKNVRVLALRVDGLRESLRLLDESQTRLAWRMGDLEEGVAGLGDDLRKEIAELGKRVLAVEWRVPYVYSTPRSVPCDEGTRYYPECGKDDTTGSPPPRQQGSVCKTETGE